MRKMLERQTKNLPPEQKEMIMTLLEKDPALFEKIAKEVQEEMKKGKSQMHASMAVMPKYKAQIQKLMGHPKR